MRPSIWRGQHPRFLTRTDLEAGGRNKRPPLTPPVLRGSGMGRTSMEVIIVGVVGAISAVIVQGIGFFFNRKSGLSEAQEAYQGTLEGMNKALTGRVTELEKTVADLSHKNELLEQRVEDLTRQVRDLTVENLDLLRRLVDAGIKK